MKRSQLIGTTATMILFGVLCAGFYIGFGPPSREARSRAEMLACQHRVRILAQALMSYAGSHGGRFPPSLSELGDKTQLPPFKCPATAADYRYMGNGVSKDEGEKPILACPLDAHGGRGGYVVSANGEVTWFAFPTFETKLAGCVRPSTRSGVNSQ